MFEIQLIFPSLFLDIFPINLDQSTNEGFENTIIINKVNKYGSIIKTGWISLPFSNKFVDCWPIANNAANINDETHANNVFHLEIITIAIAKNPKLLLCDEPTGALDYKTGKQILQLLQDTARKENMTVIIITHNGAIAPMADKIIRFKNGTAESIESNRNPIPVENIEWWWFDYRQKGI